MKADWKTSSSSNVLECSASYYNAATKKWDLGCFTLAKNHVQFVCNSVQDAQFHLCLPLSTITCLEKRLSNFIYSSLVICVASEKHWFGSFSNRDAVYNLLELFWRESLISKPHRKSSPPKVFKTNSSLGKELLGILNESKNTLIGTANALSDQNRQLYEAEEAVEDLNNDLTKAEEAIKSLSLPITLTNFINNSKDDVVDIKVDPLHRFKVTFSFSNDENKVDWEKGILVISSDVILLKVEEKTLIQITKDELEVLQVLSPWELCIIHTFSGVRKSCYFMCPQLSRLLKFMCSITYYKEKVVYIDDDNSMYDTASCSSFGSAVNSPSSSSAHSNTTQKEELNYSQAETNICAHSKEEIQELTKLESDSNKTQENSCVLSEEEIQELNYVLQNLQTLAAEVGKEQENQLGRVNALVENMEKSEERMKKDTKLVKKKNLDFI